MRVVRRAAVALPALAALLLSSCSQLAVVSDTLSGEEACDTEPLQPGSVAALAKEIDHLEKRIEKFGSIVPKHADVWGQARLTMHRQEYEVVMKQNLQAFNQTLQGAVTRSDQAFLASAIALQAAVSGGGPGRGSAASAANQMNFLPATDVTGLIDTAGVINRSGFTPAFRPAVTSLSLEPTIVLNQQDRYLHHLQELRRLNEGDDNTDAPGYALNLVRLPVSILPGACTQTGYGAELTATLTPVLGDDLLPKTFRNLVIQDLSDLLTLPVTRVIEVDPGREVERMVRELDLLLDRRYPAPLPGQIRAARLAAADVLPPTGRYPLEFTPHTEELNEVRRIVGTVGAKFAQAAAAVSVSRRSVFPTPVASSQLMEVFGPDLLGEIIVQVRRSIGDHLVNDHPYHLDVEASLDEELSAAYEFLKQPQTQHLWRFCTPELVHAIRTRNSVQVKLMREDFLEDVRRLQPEAYGGLRPISDRPDDRGSPFRPEKAARSPTVALAWAVLVESALLNERLVEDMQACQAKGCPPMPDGAFEYFLPRPTPEARQQFNAYVACRWPLHVFAIDPVTEDQNVFDAFVSRREMQLAMMVAFASGNLSARAMERYTRRVEKEIETIALNRTVVGFSHADNTFGWRFYPRVQTPPIPGNVEVLFRDLLIGRQGPGYDLRYRRLEPGPRECVALVVMPSFVPQLTVEVSANWFKLTDPKCKELNSAQAMRLSKRVQALRGEVAGACDAGQYRPGDAALLARRVEQLSERLPLQSQLVQVPYENTHGGFTMFSSGVTDLAPELNGWYGGPGIVPDGTTSLFLVGDHFSVHQTRVVAGGVGLKADLPNVPPPGGPLVSPAPAAAAAQAAADKALADKMTADRLAAASVTLGQAAAEAANKVAAAAAEVTRTTQAVADAQKVSDVAEAALKLDPNNKQKQQAAADAKAALTRAQGAAAVAANTKAAMDAANTKAAADAKDASDKATQAQTIAKQSADDAQKAAQAAGQVVFPRSQTTADLEVELLSRQIARIKIPGGCQPKEGFIDVHVATPYGVSRPLRIPVTTAPKPGYAVAAGRGAVTATYDDRGQKKGQGPFRLVGAPAGSFLFAWQGAAGAAPERVKALFLVNVGPDTQWLLSPSKPIWSASGLVEVRGDDLKEVIAQLLDKYQGQGVPDGPLSLGVTLTPLADDGSLRHPIPVTGQVQITLIKPGFGVSDAETVVKSDLGERSPDKVKPFAFTWQGTPDALPSQVTLDVSSGNALFIKGLEIQLDKARSTFPLTDDDMKALAQCVLGMYPKGTPLPPSVTLNFTLTPAYEGLPQPGGPVKATGKVNLTLPAAP
jgi:hypothetical protein